MRNKLKAREEFLTWFKGASPTGYKIVMSKVSKSTGLGSADSPSKGGFWASIADTFNKVLPTITQTVAQAKIFKAQMKRAQRGLPPMKVADYAPVLKISADIGRETRGALAADVATAAKTYLIPGLIAVGALVLFVVLRKK